MKSMQLLLVPVTVAWVVGGIWWVSRPGSCACATPTAAVTVPVQAALIHLGPVVDEAAAANVATVIVPTNALIIPFSKNTGEFTPSAEELEWCQAALLELGADSDAGIVVIGHTDADGDPDWNRRLSAYRARLVMEGLVGAGIPAGRIRAEGRGADEPVADNLTSKGKALNRRVEVRVAPLQ